MAAQTALTSDNCIDDYALARIDFRVGRLVEAFRLGDGEAEDLRQDMIAELLKARVRHNPARCQRNTFINRTLDRYYLHAARALANRQKHESMRPTPISAMPTFSPTVNDPRRGERSEQERVDVAIDLAEVVSNLPPELQRICEALRLYKPSEAARRLGMHRSTIYRAMREIRRHFTAAGLGPEG